MAEQYARLAELDNHIEPHLTGFPVTVSVAVREPEFTPGRLLPIFELGARRGLTVKIIAPESFDEGQDRHQLPKPASNKKPESADLSKTLWGSLRGVLVALGACPPKADPRVLADALYERRRLRLVCDTNSLAYGTASWLLSARWNRADLIISSVVDRELHGWTDRINDSWLGTSHDGFKYRSNYRSAFSFLETTPDGVMVDRIAAPEQSALMLSKVGDNQGKKSPDADILLIEHARALIRDQARNARTIYLTGDLTNARVAVNSLGPTEVLYMAADTMQAKNLRNRTTPWGWWKPGPMSGSGLVPSLSRIVQALLGPFDLVVFETASTMVYVRSKSDLPPGCPSEWADPICTFLIEPKLGPSVAMPMDPISAQASEEGSEQATQSPPKKPSDMDEQSKHKLQADKEEELKLKAAGSTLDPKPSSDPKSHVAALSGEVLSDKLSEVNVASGADEPTQLTDLFDDLQQKRKPRDSNPTEPGLALPRLDRWLLPPGGRERPLSIPPRYRLSPKPTFHLLAYLLDIPLVLEEQPSAELLDEAEKVLIALGAMSAKGGPGGHANHWRQAWLSSDLDWIHRQFMRHSGYCDAVEAMRANPKSKLPKRLAANLSMARALGQVAIHPAIGKSVGDAPLESMKLLDCLSNWMPHLGDTLTMEQLCLRAAVELEVTPYRLERAMETLWRSGHGTIFVPEAGGTAEGKYIDKVVHLSRSGYHYRQIFWSVLGFGSDKAFRFVRRVK